MITQAFAKLEGYKTYIAAAATALTALAAYLNHDVSGAEAFKTAADALMAACIRHGISTTTKGN